MHRDFVDLCYTKGVFVDYDRFLITFLESSSISLYFQQFIRVLSELLTDIDGFILICYRSTRFFINTFTKSSSILRILVDFFERLSLLIVSNEFFEDFH